MPFLRRWAWVGLPLIYGLIFSILALRLHAGFRTYALDMGQFDQAIWNTAQGRFMVNTLRPPNSMAWHFSPGFALLAPLYWIWPDPRLLLLAQVAALTLSGVPLYLYARRRLAPLGAILVLAGYYLAPGLQTISLMEFKRISLAIPAIALAWYALVTRRPWLVGVSLFFALLFKEDVTLLVIPFGLYMILASRATRKHGIVLVLGGIVWLALTLFVFLPLFRGEKTPAEAIYPQLGYFSFLKNKTSVEAVRAVLRRPWLLVEPVFRLDRLQALLRVLGPMALLPLLAPDILALALPMLLVLQSSTVAKVFQLRDYYVTPLLPVFYGAAVIALSRLPRRLRPWGILALLLSSLVGFYLYSPGLGGRAYDPALYLVEPRHRLGEMALRTIPPQASVSAQCGVATHVAHRQEVYQFPIKAQEVDYVALDLKGNRYPLLKQDYILEVKKLLVDPTWSLQQDCSGFLIFKRDANAWPGIERHEALGGVVELVGFDWAVSAPGDGCFASAGESPLPLHPGQTLRLALYWRTLGPVSRDYTVFTHLVRADGTLLGQHDGQPGNVNLWDNTWAPMDAQLTSHWHVGQIMRDVHYLTVGSSEQPVGGSVQVGWYDGETGERLQGAAGQKQIVLGQFVLRP